MTRAPVAKIGAPLAAALLLAAGPALAQDADKAIDNAVKARQSLMTLNSFNIGQLVAMAKGQAEYDAESAQAAADNLAAIASIDQSRMWPEGSDNEALGEKKTEALPAIWESYPKFEEKQDDLRKATAEFAQSAGQDLDALKAGIGPVGKACGACHEDFRQKDE